MVSWGTKSGESELEAWQRRGVVWFCRSSGGRKVVSQRVNPGGLTEVKKKRGCLFFCGGLGFHDGLSLV